MLSFFSAKGKAAGLAGLEVREDGVGLVHVVREPGRVPRVTACDFRAWNGAPPEQVLARLAADYDLKRARCTTVLDAGDYTLLLTEAPDVPADELRSAVRWRIKDLIDFHVDDATVDVFDVAMPNTPGKTRSMYVVAARNSAIQRRVDLCDAADIGLDVIDIPEMAQRNLALTLPADVRGVVVLTLARQRGLITITRQGEIFLSRRLEIGLETLGGAEDRTAHFDQIALEVQRSLDYFDSHFRQPHVEGLVLSPSAAAIPGLLDYLNENLNLNAAAMRLSDMVQFDPAFSTVLSEQALLALGAALRQEEKAL